VARDVLLRKLLYVRQLLIDLEPFRTATQTEVEEEHYKIERLFELLVMVASDIIVHLLREQNVVPTSYRDGFRLAGEHKLLPVDLAERLQEAASMRNLIVHLYEQIDYAILQRSIEPHLDDFGQFVAHIETYLDDHID